MKAYVLAAALTMFGNCLAHTQEIAIYSQERGSLTRGLLLIGENGNERFFELNSIFGEQPGERLANISFDASTGMYYILLQPSNATGGLGWALVSVDPNSGERILMGRYNSGNFSFLSSTPFLNLGGSGSLPGLNAHVERAIQSSSAVASALEIQLPVDGQRNRLGLTNGTFGDEHAFGVSYARVQGRFDVGLAYAQGSGGRNAGKVSVGFSW